MSRIAILTCEGNPIASDLFYELSQKHTVWVIYSKNTNRSLGQIWERKHGLRWFWYNWLFDTYAKKYLVGHKPKVLWDVLQNEHQHSFKFVQMHNATSCAKLLAELDLDIGIVIGTRILKPLIFTVPKYGMINLHQGRIPEYRGVPPAFWEHANKEATMYVTVHTVVENVDAGMILCEQAFSIHDHAHYVISKYHANTLSCAMLIEGLEKAVSGQKGEQRMIANSPRTVPGIKLLMRETIQLFNKRIQ